MLAGERAVSDSDVEAVARRVVELLAEDRLTAAGWVDTATVARRYDVGEDWVRSHAVELGAVRLGDRRGPLRFDLGRVAAAMERRRVTGEPPARRRRRPGPRRASGSVRLLPLPEGAS
jgi:hypothetical protein